MRAAASRRFCVAMGVRALGASVRLGGLRVAASTSVGPAPKRGLLAGRGGLAAEGGEPGCRRGTDSKPWVPTPWKGETLNGERGRVNAWMEEINPTSPRRVVSGRSPRSWASSSSSSSWPPSTTNFSSRRGRPSSPPSPPARTRGPEPAAGGGAGGGTNVVPVEDKRERQRFFFSCLAHRASRRLRASAKGVVFSFRRSSIIFQKVGLV
jgi:hypothetical protein